jgi:hypothetical protein
MRIRGVENMHDGSSVGEMQQGTFMIFRTPHARLLKQHLRFSEKEKRGVESKKFRHGRSS